MKLDKKFILNSLFAISLFFSIMFLFEGIQNIIDLFEFEFTAVKITGVMAILALAALIILNIVLACRGNSKKLRCILTILISICLLLILIYFIIGSTEKGGVNLYILSYNKAHYQSIIVSVIPMFVAAGILSGVTIYSAYSKKEKL